MATFTPSQIRAFLTRKPRTWSQHRLYALAAILFDTGPRIEEVLALKRTDVDLDNLLLTVFGKGQKERRVPMSFELRRVLYRWLSKHDFPRVFPMRDGAHLGQRNTLRDLKLLGRQLGITGVRVSFHTLRHTLAVNYIATGETFFDSNGFSGIRRWR